MALVRSQVSGKPFARSVAMLCVVWILGGLVSGCSREASGDGSAQEAVKRPTVPITAAAVIEKSVPVQLDAIGNVRALATVEVKAQNDGELQVVHFTEGQEVKKGDPLFTIDPRPFDAKLKQAEANLAKDRAQLVNARKQAERYGAVVSKGYVSAQQYDEMVATAKALEATIQADEAAVESARLALKYCYIASPIAGKTGELKIHQGNLVKANDSGSTLVTINQVSPISVVFSVPEQYLAEIKKYMAQKQLSLQAAIPGDPDAPLQGELAFLDNAVDPNTGTIQLKATFPNKDKRLWPGQFVNVRLTLTTQDGARVVPSHAVQTGQQGQYVYVVKPDQTVEYRPVVVARTLDGESIIGSGLEVGEQVVTDGQLKLAPGSPVHLIENGEKGQGGAS